MNRRLVGLVLLYLTALSLPVCAQEAPEFQVFAGYSFLREGLSPDLKELDLEHANATGWHFALTDNVNGWFGGVADFSGTYTRPKIKEFDNFQVNHQLYTFLFGPEVAFRRFGKVVPFAHALVGAAHVRFSLPSRSRDILNSIGGLPPEIADALAVLNFSVDEDAASKTEFSWAVGGGLDVNLTRSISFRTQVDVVRTHFADLGDDRQSHVRASAGIVLRFGQR